MKDKLKKRIFRIYALCFFLVLITGTMYWTIYDPLFNNPPHMNIIFRVFMLLFWANFIRGMYKPESREMRRRKYGTSNFFVALIKEEKTE